MMFIFVIDYQTKKYSVPTSSYIQVKLKNSRSFRVQPQVEVLVMKLSRSLTVDFILFSLFTLFYFSFLFLFLFLFLEQLGLGFISHTVISVTN